MLGIYNTHHTLVSGRSGGDESVHATLCISGNLAHREWRWSSVMPALLPHTAYSHRHSISVPTVTTEVVIDVAVSSDAVCRGHR